MEDITASSFPDLTLQPTVDDGGDGRTGNAPADDEAFREGHKRDAEGGRIKEDDDN